MSSSENQGLKEITTGLSEYYQPGDYIVAKYNAHGAKQKKGRIFGEQSEVIGIAEKIAQHAMHVGGDLLPDQRPKHEVPQLPDNKANKKGKKATKAPQQQAVLRIDGFANEVTEEKLDHTSARDLLNHTRNSTSNDREESYKTLNVVFSNKLGKIKVKVIDILEEDTSICLVFKDENDLSFEPQQGEILNVILYGDREYKVMYPGFLYTWMDKTKKLMILVKTQQGDEDE